MSWLSKIAGLLLLLAFFSGGKAFADLPVNFYGDITCPSPPAMEGCEYPPKCPDGYALNPSFSVAHYLSTGIYVCSPLDSGLSADKYRSCVYYNPACYKAKSSYRASTEYYSEKVKEVLSARSSGETYVRRLVRLFTLDPELVDELSSSSAVASQNSFYLFIAEAAKAFNDAIFNSSLYFVALGSLWILTLGLGGTILEELRGNISPRILGLRLLALGTFLWIPMPHVGNSSTYWQPLFFDAVRTAVSIGNDLAQEAGDAMNAAFFTTAFFKVSNDLGDALDLLEKRAKDTYSELKELEEDVKACYQIYGIADFLSLPSIEDVPDADQELARKLGRERKGNPAYYSKLKCVEIEKKYKDLVLKYNQIAVTYHHARGIRDSFTRSVPISDVIAHPERYESSEDTTVRAIAGVAKASKDLGWVSFPLITLPVARLSLTFSPSAVMGEDLKEPNAFIKAMGILTLPPGNWITQTMLSISGKASDLIAPVFTAIGTATGGFVGAAAGFIGGKIISKLAGVGLGAFSLFLSYKFTVAVLNALPVMVLVGVFVIRFVLWLLDTLKLMMASPFIFVHAFSTRNYYEAYLGIRSVLVVAIMPLILLVSALFAYAGVEAARFLVGDLGMRVLDVIDAVKDSVVWKATVKWPLEGFVYWASVVVQTVMAYKLMMGTPEWFLEKMRLREGQPGMAEHLFEGIFRRGLPI